jgi:hypothetical protein
VLRRDSPRQGERVHFLEKNIALWSAEETRILYGRSATRTIALLVANSQGATAKAIGDACEKDVSTARYHLNILRDRDLVRRLRFGHSVEYIPLGLLRDWMAAVGDRYSLPAASADARSG